MPESDYSLEGYYDKLKGRLYGLLCEREKDGAWQKFLDTIYIEMLGFVMMTDKNINFWLLMSKISALRFLDYEHFRKTIFECINLVGGLNKP